MSTDPKQGPREAGQATSGFGVVTEPGTVRLERVLPGPIERAWAYLTEPEKRGQWLARGAMDLRVGGRVKLEFNHAELSPGIPLPKDHQSCEVNGQIMRCEPPRLLSFTWNDGHGDLSEVTFELTARGNSVLLVLTHRRLDDRAHRVGVASGWHTHTGILVDILNGRKPHPFWPTKVRMDSEYDQRLPS